MKYTKTLLKFSFFPFIAFGCTSSSNYTTQIEKFERTRSTLNEQLIDEESFVSVKKAGAAYLRNVTQFVDEINIKDLDQNSADKLYNFIFLVLLKFDDPKLTARLIEIFKIKTQNNWFDNTDIHLQESLSLYDLLLHKGDFSQAERFFSHYLKNTTLRPDLTLLGKLETENSAIRNVLKPTERLGTFNVKQIGFENFSGIIVVSHPQCNFSKRALNDIQKNSGIQTAFEKSATFISPSWKAYNNPNYVTNVSKKDWNIVVDQSEWPEINYWGSPSFYFFENSKLKKKIVGWPKNSGEEKIKLLKEGFDAINQPL